MTVHSAVQLVQRTHIRTHVHVSSLGSPSLITSPLHCQFKANSMSDKPEDAPESKLVSLRTVAVGL